MLLLRLDTDEGVTGYGEMAVINASYGDQFATGARAGVGDLAPLLVGLVIGMFTGKATDN